MQTNSVRRLRFTIAVCAAAWLAPTASALAQLSPGGMGGPGGGGGAPNPALERPDFNERVVNSGGPLYGPGENQPLVVDVQVLGNRTFSTSWVLNRIKTRRDRVFDPEVVQADVRNLLSQGLRNVRTYTKPAQGGVIVIYEVFERPTVAHLIFHGNRAISDKNLRKQCGIKEGDALNRYAVEEGRRKIEEFYVSKGFAHVQVEVLEGNNADDRGVVYGISEGHLNRIADVEFIGNEIASDGRLKTQIQSKPGFMWYLFRGKVDNGKIEEDVEKLTSYYRALGYFQARVRPERAYDASGKWLDLRFVIDEGPRYRVRSLTVVGNEKFSNEAVASQLQVETGEYFNLGEMNADVSTLKDLYGSQGYIFADVKADPRFSADGPEIDLYYNVEEGKQFRVGEIRVQIEGEYPHTRHSVVMNRLSFKSGDIVDIREIRNSERRLKASQLFETNPAQGEPPQIVIRPPDLLDEVLASEDSPGGAFRGQNPTSDGVQMIDIVITAPPLKKTSFWQQIWGN